MMRNWSIAALLCLACAVPAHAFTFIVTEPGTPLVPNSVIELAAELGYFDREGVHVTLKRVSGTPLAMAALIAGQGDMANVSLDALLKLEAKGQTGFRAVSSPSKSFSFVIVARRSIASLADLRGKNFGVGALGTLDNTLSSAVLRREHVDPDALHIVSIGSPQARLKALVAGKIDATTASYGSWAALRDKSGLHVLVPMDRYFADAPVIAKVDVVAADLSPAKRAEAVKATAALITLSRDFAKNPQHWADVMAKMRPDLPRPMLGQLAATYGNEWCIDGCFKPSDLRASAEFWAKTEPSMAPPAMYTWADFSILNEALRKLDLDER
jgi:NitT/TauT family transport system substrate-binding protein